MIPRGCFFCAYLFEGPGSARQGDSNERKGAEALKQAAGEPTDGWILTQKVWFPVLLLTWTLVASSLLKSLLSTHDGYKTQHSQTTHNTWMARSG